ncbi:MAG TPA: hypothetical protein VG652_12080 [Gaiellaceae bacterium]|nr:hypothetical protein [Gaiellaceae bacterium]
MTRSSLRLLVLCAAAALCAGSAATAKASLLPNLLPSLIGGNCGATSTVFSPWGDERSYYFTASGGFESGAPGWTLTGGAQVVPGNDPFYLHGRADNSSLLLPSGATATSPSLCFGLLDPGLRFVAVSPSGTGSVHVQLVAHGLLGVLSVIDGGTVQVGSTWAPTTVFSTLGSQLDVPVGTKTIQVVLTSSGDVQIDDLYIDPFLMK